ncbi:HAD-IA family hydrolase [Halobacterium sp. KA-4]|uniref:HAD family hydrolase n=1 Tax=Halobacterium sp. KA-4 TaxID=2896367 RepID=UPI001E62C717|nr:HAD-IA family hydrolase [Halobacterium sp. KA-4]MCD2199844.1 HAD-IA family hydrolase [Halobacterium sp. KA-4]
MTDYEAVVYDLDGTLVRLAVDWAVVEREVAARLREAGVDPSAYDMWEMLDAAEDAGIGSDVHDLIASHERDGATRAERLPGADELAGLDVPAAVCSLNAEDACRTALERHDLLDSFRVVAGRDTVPARKPDPRALTWVLDELGVAPENALFVGDSASDEVTAERAGTSFRWA